MPADFITVASATPRFGILSLSGYGIRVAVERGHLVVEDGRGSERRRGRFPRTTRDLKRLIVIGHTGTVSFEALRWLSDVGCAFVHIDVDGEVIVSCGGLGLDDARLRRAQSLAATNSTGVQIARDLMIAKLQGQELVLDSFAKSEFSTSDVGYQLNQMASATTLEEVRICESIAARVYWQEWAQLPVRFARKAAKLVPDHWHVVGIRASPLTGSPRLAASPAHAIFNYLYAILEAETRIALLTMGLDPAIGIVHADLRSRDSFACDVMEAVRPQVDAYVLKLISTRHFGKEDFFETRQGNARILPVLAGELAETSPIWAAEVAPFVENIAKKLMASHTSRKSSSSSRSLPTLLTQSNRSAGRNSKQPSSGNKASRSINPTQNACRECGLVLEDKLRRYCSDCTPTIRRERGEIASRMALATLAARREVGDDPAHGGAAGESRGAKNASHQEAILNLKPDQFVHLDSEMFARDILPSLSDVSLKAMADATGLSQSYCSFIRRGLKVPHRRHWMILHQLVGGAA